MKHEAVCLLNSFGFSEREKYLWQMRRNFYMVANNLAKVK
jgi:hypothetical protein